MNKKSLKENLPQKNKSQTYTQSDTLTQKEIEGKFAVKEKHTNLHTLTQSL